MWLRALLASSVLGAVYGLIALEVVSPLAILLVIWAALMLFLAWRLPADPGALAASAIGLVVGFGVVWTVVLRSQLSSCRPPACQSAAPATDVIYALAFLAPLIALAGAEIGVREWRRARGQRR